MNCRGETPRRSYPRAALYRPDLSGSRVGEGMCGVLRGVLSRSPTHPWTDVTPWAHLPRKLPGGRPVLWHVAMLRTGPLILSAGWPADGQQVAASPQKGHAPCRNMAARRRVPVNATTIHIMKTFSRIPARSVLVMLAVAAAAIIMSSCRTTAGLGRDIQHVGNKIGNTAERAM